MNDRLTILGTGTCQIEWGRNASSVLLELADTPPILFDCGHGVIQALFAYGICPSQLEHIILSHFHPDHVSDLIPFLQAGAWSKFDPRSTDVHIYGPPGVQDFMQRLLGLFGPWDLRRDHYQVHIHEQPAGELSVAGRSFDWLSLPPAGNHGLRFMLNGKRCAITGDSKFHAEEIDFLRDVDLAIFDTGHLPDNEIIQLMIQSQARLMVGSHFYRPIDPAALQSVAIEQGYRGTLINGRDGMTLV